MKILFTALASLISVNLFSKIIDYDGNNDGCINSTDILNILSIYGECESIYECGTIVEYDGYEYTTVQIGNKCWFAENLRTNQTGVPSSLSDQRAGLSIRCVKD